MPSGGRSVGGEAVEEYVKGENMERTKDEDEDECGPELAERTQARVGSRRHGRYPKLPSLALYKH